MKKYFFILSIVLSFSFCFQAHGKKVLFRKSQKVDFSETSIDGVARTPDGAYLHQKRGVEFLPLYKVRKQFDKEVRNSIEYLR